MNLANLTILTSLVLAPTVTRPEPNRIVVEGVQYAGLTPEAEVIAGEEIMYGFAFGDSYPISFQVNPLVVYQVHTFQDGDESPDDYTVLTTTPDRKVAIDHIIEQRIYWERQFFQLRDGTHPAIDGPVDFYELRESMARVHRRMEGTP